MRVRNSPTVLSELTCLLKCPNQAQAHLVEPYAIPPRQRQAYEARVA